MAKNRKDIISIQEAALDVYADIIRQSRVEEFYETLGVPDTKEGRFDLITLHMFLILRKLKQGSAEAKAFAQELFNVMFKNMDYSLREMGVGDLTVGKKVRGLAEDFYGRVGVYEEALDNEDNSALADAIYRNVLNCAEGHAASSERLARYVHAINDRLTKQTDARISLGLVSFPKLQSVS